MITPAQKEKIVEVLGKHYSRKILVHLMLNDLKTRSGRNFRPLYIRQLIGGFEENLIIEDEIFELVEITFNNNKAKLTKREKMLKSLKI